MGKNKEVSKEDWLRRKARQGYATVSVGAGVWKDLRGPFLVTFRIHDCCVAHHPEGRSAAWSRFEVREDGKRFSEGSEFFSFRTTAGLGAFLENQGIALKPRRRSIKALLKEIEKAEKAT